MVVTPNDQPSKSKRQTEVDPAGDEPPPSYSPQSESPAIPGGTVPTTFKTKPTNYLSLFNEHNAIRGEFVIDPSIRIPSSMLPPLGEHETEHDRKNLRLGSKNSSVKADIWLLNGAPQDDLVGAHKSRRTTIALTSGHGSISAQVHNFDDTVPFLLSARAAHGTVRLALPRSFQGLLSLSTRHGSVSLSDTLVQAATQLSQLDVTRRYFVGNLSALGEDTWQGDHVEVEAPHGSIHVKYVDDTTEAPGKKGVLSRFFGM